MRAAEQGRVVSGGPELAIPGAALCRHPVLESMGGRFVPDRGDERWRASSRTITRRTCRSSRSICRITVDRAFTRPAGELHYQIGNGEVLVAGDVNGDGKADFLIHVANVETLVASDFVL